MDSKPDPSSTLTQLAEAAFRQAAAKVVRRAKQYGTPLILWDGENDLSVSAEEYEDLDRQEPTGEFAVQEDCKDSPSDVKSEPGA